MEGAIKKTSAAVTPRALAYLLALHAQGSQSVSTNNLAERLGVRPASVTGMLHKLERSGLIEHRPYHGAVLTSRGQELAQATRERQQLLTRFLTACLGFTPEAAVEEAKLLANHVSEQFLARAEQVLSLCQG